MKCMIVPAAALIATACSPSADQETSAAVQQTEPAPAAPVASEQANDPRVAEWLRAENPDAEGLMVRTGRVDLDADGVEELLIYLGGPGMCGSGGCNLIVLKDDGERLSRLGELSVAQLPVGVLDSTTNGLRDLAVTTYGGGAPERIMKVPFDGAAYASNPTVPPAAPSDTLGRQVIGEGELQPLN